jgi:hypothetical protein
MELSGGAIQWNVSFVRSTQNWEVDVFVSFYRLLYSVRLRREGIDKLRWVPSKRGMFSVKSFYNVLGCLDGFSFSLEECLEN